MSRSFTPTDYAGEALPYNDGVSRAGGDIFQLADGNPAYVDGLQTNVAGQEYAAIREAIGDVPCASAVVASAGDEAYWDTSAKTLKVADAQNGAPANCIYAGLFGQDKADGETTAQLLLGFEAEERHIKAVYTSGTWAVKTGFASLITYEVTINRAGVQLATNPTLSVSGGTLTIADTASGYGRQADDIAMITVTGLGI